MQFATTGNPLMDWALDALCKRGAIATSVSTAEGRCRAADWGAGGWARSELHSVVVS